MSSFKDFEKLNSVIQRHANAFQGATDYQNKMADRECVFTEDMVEFLKNPSTPESARLDTLIDLISDMNERLDSQYEEQILNQQKIEAWHEEDAESGRRSYWVGIFTLGATIFGIIIGAAVTIGIQFLPG